MGKRILSGTVLALVVLLAVAAPASATPPTNVSGKYGPPSAMGGMEWRPAGNNCKLEVEITYPFTGDLEGSATFHYSAMVHGPCTVEVPPLPGMYYTNLHARGTFTGQVYGQMGSFDFTYEGIEQPWVGFDPGALALTAHIVVLSGTGDLANLRGVFDVTNHVGDPYDVYSGQVHFDGSP